MDGIVSRPVRQRGFPILELNDMDSELAQRLERLETTLAHLERQCDELNQVVVDQAKAIRRLQSAQQRISETIETAEMDRIKSTNAKPPHYQ